RDFHVTGVQTCALPILSLGLVIFSSRLRILQRVPGPLVALVVAAVLQAIFRFDSVATIGSAFGGIPRGLPEFALPEITMSRVIRSEERRVGMESGCVVA